jgi:CheY-like chemotaxis protein
VHLTFGALLKSAREGPDVKQALCGGKIRQNPASRDGTAYASESAHRIDHDLQHADSSPASLGPRRMSETILIVDDDTEAVRTFADWLQLQGYEVRTASDGEAAWPQVSGVDAIILDARMPILDGLGFLRRLRASGEDVPVAIVTGDYLIDDAVLNEFQRLNAQIVFKPLWLDDLVALAAQLVNRATPS